MTSAIAKIAATSAPVVIHGELGTGKELVARAIHAQSGRRAGPFIRFACRAEGEPTSASLEAHGGTLLLDEVAALSPSAQAVLLEILEDPRVRVIATTSEALDERTKEGAFREDLFFRLNVVPLRVPPLRERAGDIEALAAHFARAFGQAMGKRVGLAADALASLRRYDWPGNVRELRNVIERACVLADADVTLERDELSFDFAPAERAAAAGSTSIFEEISSEEAERVRDALKQAKGNRARAARLLGLPRTTLNDRIKRLGLA
jgi:DNA-binding NtrC family response regulator